MHYLDNRRFSTRIVNLLRGMLRNAERIADAHDSEAEEYLRRIHAGGQAVAGYAYERLQPDESGITMDDAVVEADEDDFEEDPRRRFLGGGYGEDDSCPPFLR